MKQYIDLSKKVFSHDGFKELRHRLAFIMRSLAHYRQMNEFIEFLQGNPLRRDIAEEYPAIYSQAVRPFFFRKSTFEERASLIKEHFTFFENRFCSKALHDIYSGEGIVLWSTEYKSEILSLNLSFRDINKKEGLMTIILKLGQTIIYQLVFWAAPDKTGKIVFWIGALQGLAGGSDIIRCLTKYFYGYRPKNLMLHVVRCIAEYLNVDQIYAVSNFGFYDSTLPKHKQKLRTSFDEFWQETGGILYDDPRFYILPVKEPQKTIEEVVSHKRNLYRKRYAMIAEIEEFIGSILKQRLIAKV